MLRSHPVAYHTLGAPRDLTFGMNIDDKTPYGSAIQFSDKIPRSPWRDARSITIAWVEEVADNTRSGEPVCSSQAATESEAREQRNNGQTGRGICSIWLWACSTLSPGVDELRRRRSSPRLGRAACLRSPSPAARPHGELSQS